MRTLLALALLAASPAAAEDPRASAVRKLRMGDDPGAVASADEALRLHPGDWRVFNLKAFALNRMADDKKLPMGQRRALYARAEDAAAQAVRLSPASAAALESLALAQVRQGKYREASASADRAIALDAKSSRGRAIRAYAQEALEIGQMIAALRRPPASTTEHHRMAQAQLELGRRLEALDGVAPSSPGSDPEPPPGESLSKTSMLFFALSCGGALGAGALLLRKRL